MNSKRCHAQHLRDVIFTKVKANVLISLKAVVVEVTDDDVELGRSAISKLRGGPGGWLSLRVVVSIKEALTFTGKIYMIGFIYTF